MLVWLTLAKAFSMSSARVYSILIHTGKGGGELTREKIRGAIVHKVGV